MTLKVAILDDYQNLSGPYISSLSNLAIDVYRDTILPADNLDALVSRLEPYEIIVTMRERTPITKDLLERLPRLRVLLTTGLRNRGIDLEVAKARGVLVAGTPNVRSAPDTPPDFNSTVQHTWALILSLVNNIPRDQSLISTGSWLSQTPLNTFIGGSTLGLLGLGKLGTGTARIGKLAFGTRIIAWSPHLTQERADEAAVEAGLAKGDIVAVSKDDLFASADILSIHLVLAPETKGIVTQADLDRMKLTAFLVNTSRGPIVDEKALLATLKAGKIRGAALDVFDIEPLPLDSPWRTTKWGQDGSSEVVYTPHSGYSFENHLQGMWESTRVNLERISRGEEVQWKFA